MRTLSLKVPEALDRDLAELAARRGVSKSALIRDAMTQLVVRQRSGDAPPAGSFLALAEDLAGCVTGPEDLSTNEDYLDGYGRAATGRAATGRAATGRAATGRAATGRAATGR